MTVENEPGVAGDGKVGLETELSVKRGDDFTDVGTVSGEDITRQEGLHEELSVEGAGSRIEWSTLRKAYVSVRIIRRYLEMDAREWWGQRDPEPPQCEKQGGRQLRWVRTRRHPSAQRWCRQSRKVRGPSDRGRLWRCWNDPRRRGGGGRHHSWRHRRHLRIG